MMSTLWTEFSDVSRETLSRLVTLEELVLKWSGTINLVADSTLPEIRMRHINDSLFIARTMPGETSWMDIGSGAGFPGLVVAILYHGQRSVTLVESDRRKAEFLRMARRVMELDIEIINDRIENIEMRRYDVISARALAPLNRLLGMCYPFNGPGTTLILPKGRCWRAEVLASQGIWEYDHEVIENPDEEDAVVLKITNLDRAAT